MAIPASFDSATGALTGDNLDNTIASGRDAARPTPSLRGDPDDGGQIQSVVQQFAGGQHQSTASDMAGASDQLLMLGATSRLVQATASFSAAGAADTSTTLPLGGETSQPSFLTTPQHP